MKVTETQTGIARTTVSDSAGLYVLNALRPTDYTLVVSMPAFRQFAQKGITLLADQSATINVKLEVGSASETVNVEASAVQVDTATGTLRQVVDSPRMVTLPLNGRNAAQLTTLVAGAVTAPCSSSALSTRLMVGAADGRGEELRQPQRPVLLYGGSADSWSGGTCSPPSIRTLLLRRPTASRNRHGSERHGQARPRRQPSGYNLPRGLPFRQDTCDVTLCVGAERVAGTTTSLPVSGSAISSMTPFSTVNRSARTTASAPCNASRLPAATTAARPIFAASVRADS